MSGRYVVCLRRLDALCPFCGREGRVYTAIPGGTVWEPSCTPNNCRQQRRLALAGRYDSTREIAPVDDRRVYRRPA